MKKLFFTIILCLVAFSNINAQKIEMKKSFGTNMYMQDGKRLNAKQLTDLMKGNEKALSAIKKAKTNNTWATVLGGAGGFLVGFPIGTSIGGGDAKWELAAVGAGLIVAAIPLNSAYNKHSKKAVNLYNNEISSSAYHFKPEFNLNLKGTGLGITMSF
ncbi:hypothetical protein [Polaribacter aquimarinus]|uniref:Uncharacterized protein n=1 Tax=Polaribacter aquimarinus TaxID=2100726 RepID=A0A2U2JCV1_9FLAO|nr:hypothetical protein [Polaribacter aquimarinus]PWG06145.1 hypothetical protein DIS07_06865 [Polaribacter aquimarinus]